MFRRGSWYSLNRVERGILDLTIRYVDEIKSETLTLAVSRIICKILKMLKSPFLRKAENYGLELADKISKIAVSWGNTCASEWTCDRSFIRYLGVQAINNGWR